MREDQECGHCQVEDKEGYECMNGVGIKVEDTENRVKCMSFVFFLMGATKCKAGQKWT